MSELEPENPNPLARETRRVLRERQWSLRTAELRTGVKYSTIQNMTIGRNVDAENLIRFAVAIQEDPNRWLEIGGKDFRLPAIAPRENNIATSAGSAGLSRDSGSRSGTHITPLAAMLRLPVIGRIAAGTPTLAEVNIEEYVTVPQEWLPRNGERAQCYALRVRGDSMIGADIHDSDVLAVQMVETAEDGQVVVARIGEEVTVKRLRYAYDHEHPWGQGNRGRGYLYSDPEDFMEPIPLGTDAAVIGLPVGYLRKKPAAWG